jgi:ABC-type lipoprotein export system ATPase subunit
MASTWRSRPASSSASPARAARASRRCFYLLGALDRPTSGEVLIEGQPTAGLDDLRRGALRAERLGFVFQFHFLLPEFTSVENVTMPDAAPP